MGPLEIATFHPIEHYRKDGRLVLLKVRNGDHPTENAPWWVTIGSNNYENDGIDEWSMAGWCWSHDHWTDGNGEILGFIEIGKPTTNAGDRS